MSLTQTMVFCYHDLMRTSSFIFSCLLSCTAILLGILFFNASRISWIALYLLLILINLILPIGTHHAITHHHKPKDPIDAWISSISFLYAIFLILFPRLFEPFLFLLCGLWMAFEAFISFIDFLVITHDGTAGAGSRLTAALFSLILSFLMIFGKTIHLKTGVLSLVAGIFFLIWGIRSLILTITRRNPYGFLAAHTHWSLSVPLLAGALMPISAYISIHSLQHSSTADLPIPSDDDSLHVYIYLHGTGFEMFGHIDIAYKGMIYSYGCHDPRHRTLMGTLGDGVLIRADEKNFIRHAINNDDSTIISYGIALSDFQKTVLQERIHTMMARTVSWHCAYETDHSAADYVSRVYKSTGCELYKFTSGKFRTYFVSSTNCVLLADELIRSKQLHLVTPGGFITPGAYLAFLNDAWQRKEGNVKERKIYATANRSYHD